MNTKTLWSGFPFRQQFDKACSASNVLSLRLTFPVSLSILRTRSGQSMPNFFAASCPFSTVLTDECFLEVILSIYHFKRVNFLFENGTFESKTLQQYGHVTIEAFSVPPRDHWDVTTAIVINSCLIPPEIH